MDSQKQESPHRAGFLGYFANCSEQLWICIWWSRGDLNPRPPALRYRFYMLIPVYCVNPLRPDGQGALGELYKF